MLTPIIFSSTANIRRQWRESTKHVVQQFNSALISLSLSDLYSGIYERDNRAEEEEEAGDNRIIQVETRATRYPLAEY